MRRQGRGKRSGPCPPRGRRGAPRGRPEDRGRRGWPPSVSNRNRRAWPSGSSPGGGRGAGLGWAQTVDGKELGEPRPRGLARGGKGEAEGSARPAREGHRGLEGGGVALEE